MIGRLSINYLYIYMAQQRTSRLNSASFIEKNLSVSLLAGTNSVLSASQTAGFNNFSLTITNYADSLSDITDIIVYASQDGTIFCEVGNETGPIMPGSTWHYEFNSVSKYLKVDVITIDIAYIDVHLIGQ